MASASILEAKKQQVAAISERLNGAVAGAIRVLLLLMIPRFVLN